MGKGYNWCHRTIKNYKWLLWKLHTNKMENQEEIDKFLEICNFSKLNQEKNRKYKQTDYWY